MAIRHRSVAVALPAPARPARWPSVRTRESLGGMALLAPTVTRRLIAEFARLRPPQHRPEALAELTPRESEILRLVAEGLSNRAIAARHGPRLHRRRRQCRTRARR